MLLFGFAPSSGVIYIVPLTGIYGLLHSHTLDFSIKVLNLIWLMALNVPRASSFSSTQFFYLNLGCWYVVLSTNLSFSNIALLYYYINLRLPINFSLSSDDIYLSLGTYLSLSFVTVSELFFGETSEIFVTLSAVLLPIKSLLVYAALLFETVLNASVTQRAHHVKWRSIRRGYYVYTSKTKFRRISTLSPRTFFEKISLFSM